MTFLRSVIPLYFFLFEHDLRANASRLSRGKTGTHFSGSCSIGAAVRNPRNRRTLLRPSGRVPRWRLVSFLWRASHSTTALRRRLQLPWRHMPCFEAVSLTLQMLFAAEQRIRWPSPWRYPAALQDPPFRQTHRLPRQRRLLCSDRTIQVGGRRRAATPVAPLPLHKRDRERRRGPRSDRQGMEFSPRYASRSTTPARARRQWRGHRTRRPPRQGSCKRRKRRGST